MNVIESETKTILVIDDDPAICDFLNILLSREDFQVIATFRSAEALNLLKAESYLRFDLVIIDLQMPVPGGYSIIKEAQKEGYQKMPILVLSGKNLDKGTVDMICSEPNVKGLCRKPISAQKLVKKVRALIEASPKTKQKEEASE